MDNSTVKRGLALAIAMSYAPVAHASDAPSGTTVVVVPATCAALPWESRGWLELLRVELAADGISVALASGQPPVAIPQITVDATSCDAAATSATLSFVSGATRQARTVDLRDIAVIARPRVLAISMADLVRSVLAAPGAREPGPPRQVELSLRVELAMPETTNRESARGVSLLVAGEARLFARGASLSGARGGVMVPVRSHVALELDGGGFAGTSYDLLGSIDTAAGTLGASVLATGGAHGVTFGVGPRVEAGLGWFRATAAGPLTRSSDATSGLAFVSIAAVASVPIAGWFSGFVGLDAGTTLYGFSARADDRHVADISGTLFAVRIGFLVGRPLTSSHDSVHFP